MSFCFTKHKKDPRKRVEMDKDEEGYCIVTERFVREVCAENNQYENPVLNNTLYLHFKGFRKLAGLENYTNLKSIWLESNGLREIGGLENQHKLKMLYLHQNALQKIENLNHLSQLCVLNLSNNCITKIENLGGLVMLENLEISHNWIPDTASCEGLLELPALRTLDLKDNKITDAENVLSFFSQLKTISTLYLKGNPAVRSISQYRKTLTAHLKNLCYLDERPIFELERLAADAFVRGGREEEKRVREEY